MSITERGVRCGNHQGALVYHLNAQEVRACYSADAIDRINAKFSSAYERTEQARAGLAPQAPAGMSTYKTTPEGLKPNPYDATAKQLNFIRSLMEGRDPRTEIVKQARVRLAEHEDGQRLSKSAASDMIERLKALPFHSDRTASRPAYVTQDGMYQNPTTGEIYKVQWNRASGNGRALYAKKLVKELVEIGTDNNPDTVVRHSFEFQAGLIAKIRQEWKMNAEQAKAFGKLYGICVRCLRDLTLEESIDRAMGAVCAGKEGWK